MTEAPRRPILKLKTAPKAIEPAPVPEPAAGLPRWKCKPCGTVLTVAEDLPADEVVRCGSCGARLGKAGEFHEGAGKVRARRLPD
jgi:hypothetical protein